MQNKISTILHERLCAKPCVWVTSMWVTKKEGLIAWLFQGRLLRLDISELGCISQAQGGKGVVGRKDAYTTEAGLN